MKRKLIKKNKKKGFTLIELLAVILILGIIALIAIPTVTSVVEQSRSGAAKASANTFITKVEEQIISNSLDNDSSNDIFDNTYTVKELLEKGLEIKGTLPEEDGTVVISNGEVSKAVLIVDGYKISYDGNTNNYVVEKDSGEQSNGNNSYDVFADGTEIYYNPTSNTKCSSADINYATYDTGTVNGCLKWYAYNDDEKNSKVKMILDHSIVSEYNFGGAETESGKIMINELKTRYVSSWNNNAKNSLYMMHIEDFNKILNRTDLKSGVTEASEIEEFISSNGERSWLFEYIDMSPAWGAQNESIDVWGYWLDGYPSDYNDEGRLFCINDGKLTHEQASLGYGIGIRPSLYIDKSIIK